MKNKQPDTITRPSQVGSSSAEATRVLVVDDEPQVLEAIGDLLEAEFDVMVTTSADDALVIAEKDPSLAVIITDQRMPGISGDVLLSRVKDFSFATRILITGYADYDAVVRAINDGNVFAYVSKPWDPEGLKVTVHHAAEMFRISHELADERMFMQALMRSSTDAISFKDTDLRYQRLNDAGARVLGVDDPATALGRTTRELFDNERAALRADEEKKLLSTGVPIQDRIERVPLDDGSVRWYSANKSVIRDEFGRVIGLVGITRDVTSQKRNEEQLALLFRVTEHIAAAKSAEEAISGILKTIALATGWDTGEAWYLSDNGEFLRPFDGYYVAKPELKGFIVGREINEFKIGEGMPGRTWESRRLDWISDVRHPDSGFVRVNQAKRFNIRSGLCVPVFSSPDEVIAVLRFFSQARRGKDDHQIDMVTTVASQIGQALSRRVTEDRLIQTEERFARIMDETHHGVFVMRDDRLLFVNEAFARMFECSGAVQALSQGGLFAFFHMDEHSRLAEFNASRAKGKRTPSELRVTGVKQGGDLIVVDYRAALVPWDGDTALCGILADVTAQQALQNQLQQAQKMEALGQLTGGVAHDFNNLLTVINGNLELLARKTEELEDVKMSRWINTARRAGRRGGDLTARLLAFSRRQVLEPTVLAINDAIVGMEDLMSRSLGENINISVITNAAADVVRVDPGQLESAVLNLALNARDAMLEGGRLTIETADAFLDQEYSDKHADVSPGAYVMIAVTDSGSGIPPDVMKKVFEPFFTTKEAGKGTGLGLAMIYGFIKQSGGHVNVYSEEGKGTTFRLYLPVYRGDVKTGDGDGEAESTEQENNARILVVEDNDDVRDTAENLLDAMGYDIVLAESGLAALKILENDHRFDLLLTDIVMPGGMTGVDLARDVVARWPDIRVLYTSGYAEEALRKANQGAPEGVWLAKPYTRNHLQEKIVEALSGKTVRRNG